MTPKQTARAIELVYRMEDARCRQVRAHSDGLVYGTGTITGKRRYATYENQFYKYEKAHLELLELLAHHRN